MLTETDSTNMELLGEELADDSLAKRLVESCASGTKGSSVPNPKAVIEEQYRKHVDQIKDA